MNKHAKILGIADEAPFSPLTWSGSSYYFFSSLQKIGALSQAISAELSASESIYYKAMTFHPSIPVWKFRYRISTDRYGAMTKKIRGILDSLSPSSFSAILQIGAYYDATCYKDKITVSYHDGNVAALSQNPYHARRSASSYIKRAFEHEKGVYSRMHHIFTMSEWLANSFIKDFGINSAKITPVGAGINLPYSDITKPFKRDFSRPEILFIGKDFKRKGGESLLKAFRLVRKEFPQARLTLIGPNLNLNEDSVRVLRPISKTENGGLEKIIKAYQEASIFTMPSLYEPFGIVLCEAMAFKLPCVSTKVCAIPEIIEDNATGFLSPPGDEKELSKALIGLLKDPEMCREMGEKGYERFLKKFSWDSVAEKIKERVCSIC